MKQIKIISTDEMLYATTYLKKCEADWLLQSLANSSGFMFKDRNLG